MTTTAPNPALDLPTGLLIGDEWVFSTSAGEMEHFNPASGERQRSFPVAGPDEVQAAVAAARSALPVWRSWAPEARRDALRRLAQLMRDHATQFGLIGSLETGLIRMMADALSPLTGEWLDYFAGWTDKAAGEVTRMPGAFNYTTHEPVGVVAVLVTWNGPAGGIGMGCSAPLAAGCTIVLKSPELAPFSPSLFGMLCLEAGLPAGVVNVIAGGPDAGNALVSHRDVAKVCFTGSAQTARLIQSACAHSLTPAVFELGGKSANLVFDDADLDLAVANAVGGVGMLNGQACIAPTRMLVQRNIYDEMVTAVAGAMNSIRMGDPLDPASGMGPVISAGARDRITGMIAAAEASGAGEIVAGRTSVGPEYGNGYYVPPTVFKDVDNASTLAQNEVFGPVLAMIPFSTEDEAVALANATDYGLAAYIATRDIDRALRLAERLDAGNIAINGGVPMAGPRAPFGGFGGSGYGKQGGREGYDEFIRVKNVNIALGASPSAPSADRNYDPRRGSR